MTTKIIGRRIRECRRDKRLTQQDLADLFKVNRSTVCSWEISRTIPDVETLIRLAIIFEVSLDYLCGLENKAEKMVARISRLGVVERKTIEHLIKTYEDAKKNKGVVENEKNVSTKF